MHKHRIAVGSNLKGKIAEIGFFLGHILRVSDAIVKKRLSQDFPISSDLDELNFFFSAYLNSIQALKDASELAMDMKNTWEELSPTYGKFIYYSRTATTHDGSLPINAGQGLQTYIVGPLRRVDSKGKVKEFEPPLEDAAMLSRNIACEVLQSIKAMLIEKGADIPSPSHADLIDHLEASINSDNFIPHFVKQMMLENRDEISSSLSAANFNYARDALSAIETVRKRFELPIK